MSSTPKWYCRNKTAPTQSFAEMSKLGKDLRLMTKRIVINAKVDAFREHDIIFGECERVVERYWNLKDESKNKDLLALKKIKRSPYNALLKQKYEMLMEINDRHFCQLMFVLKKILSDLLRKSTQSEMWLNWALQITKLYNKCIQDPNKHNSGKTAKNTGDGQVIDDEDEESGGPNKFNANICSNMYPSLLLPQKPIDFAYVLQHVSQVRIEQNSLDLLFGLFNMSEKDAGGDNCESNASSLEILRILTLNMTGDGDYQQQFCEEQRNCSSGRQLLPLTQEEQQLQTTGNSAIKSSLCSKHTEYFLQRERAFLSQLIVKAYDYCPSIFGDNCSPDELGAFVIRGMRLMWSYVGLILDHVILWWIDTPISCYSLSHVDSIRKWLNNHNENDIPEPIYSTLRGVGEILTNFVCNNTWDQLFRFTLISEDCGAGAMERVFQQYPNLQQNHRGTTTGAIWLMVFDSLIAQSNSYFTNVASAQDNLSLLPVAEQIPILHRIDHSVHSFRLWVKEQSKQLCCEWRMDRFFLILEHDVRACLAAFASIKLPALTADIADILMLVCVALRTKLICEVNVNIDKLKKTTEECVQIMSEVCRILSLANFKLSFPPPLHWQQNIIDEDAKSDYVDYVLDQILLPVIKSTDDIVILKLTLKIICEAWLDYIYTKRIKFSINGAVQLLSDFDSVREWILSCALLNEQQLEKLSNHEVLRMCKGVGKILLRKPEDVISIAKSPKFEYDRKTGTGVDAAAHETQLPSEMFVSNQKHWLQLRAGKSNFSLLNSCCGDSTL